MICAGRYDSECESCTGRVFAEISETGAGTTEPTRATDDCHKTDTHSASFSRRTDHRDNGGKKIFTVVASLDDPHFWYLEKAFIMADIELVELLLRYVVLPFIIGLSTLIAVSIHYSRTSKRSDEKENRLQELQGAKKTMKEVMIDSERVLALMRYHAWGVAWRKMRPEGIFSEDLIEEDEKKWNQYDDALLEWRRNRIQYKTAIEVYFGRREAASKLFKVVDATIDKLSFELWFIYHDNPSNPNVFLETFVEDIGQTYDTIFNAIMTAIDKNISREQEEKVHRTVSSAFDELQDKVNRMCFEMSEAIRIENVGNMRRGGRNMRRSTSQSSRRKLDTASRNS